MKLKVLAVALAVMVLGGVATAADTDDAEVRVYAKVNPNLTITPNEVAPVELTVQGDDIAGTVNFMVHANVQEVSFSVEATCLYKADDPTSPHIIPIAGTGALVQPAVGNAKAPADNDLDWIGDVTVAVGNGDGTVTITSPNIGLGIHGMTSNTTEVQVFESGQSNRFSQNVAVTCEWEQIELELPTGQYSGFVRLIGTLL